MRKLFKAVSEVNGEYFSLGMAQAEIIPLPIGQKIDGGEHGISASRIRSHASKVIYYANQRKCLPIPPNMKVIEIFGDVRVEKGDWILCDSIWIQEEKQCI